MLNYKTMIKPFVTEAGYRGQIDIDIFNIDGRCYISEVNPRFAEVIYIVSSCYSKITKIVGK